MPFGLIGLMPISLLVFANPKQSDILDTTLQKFLKAVTTQNRIQQEFLKAVVTQNRILTTVLDSNANVKKVNSITKSLL